MNDNELITKVSELHRLKISVANLTEQVHDLTNDVKRELRKRGVSKTCIGEFKVSFKDFNKRRFNVNRFKKEHEKLYNDYLDTVSSSRLTIA